MKKDYEYRTHRRVPFRTMVTLLITICAFIGLGTFLFFTNKQQQESQDAIAQLSRERQMEQQQEAAQLIANDSIVINEVCRANPSTPSEIIHDYIEFYNPSELDVSLAGYRITVGEKEYVFSQEVVIPAKDYVVLNLTADDIKELHAGFQITLDDMQTIYFYNPLNDILDKMYLSDIAKGESYGRIQDGVQSYSYLTPSKKKSNQSESQIVKTYPVFSMASGFYDESFLLSMFAEEGTTIYYTLDGSEPSEKSLCYSEPILIQDVSGNDNVYANRTDISLTGVTSPNQKIDKANIVRAIGINQKGKQSETVSATYFVGFQEKSGYESLPILSIITDPSNLYDYWKGIYVMGRVYEEAFITSPDSNVPILDKANYLENWRCKGKVQLYEYNSGMSQSSDIQMSIFTDTGVNNAQKSLMLSGNETKDANSSIFGKLDLRFMNAKKLVLSNGGYDYDLKLRESLIQELVRDRNIATQRSMQCIVFLDGEYWGIYNATQPYSTAYIEEVYGVKADNVVLAHNKVTESKLDQSYMDQLVWMLENNDMSNQETYEKVKQMIDIQSLIDCYSIGIYTGNSQWMETNCYMWRSRTQSEQPYEDGKWRWMLSGMDQSTGIDAITGYRMNTFKSSSMQMDVIFHALLKNAEFRKQFVLSFLDISNNNLSNRTTNQKLSEMNVEKDAAYINQYIRYYNNSTADNFTNGIQSLVDFFSNRMDYIAVYLAETFGLQGTLDQVTVEVKSPKGSTVQMNSSLLELDEEARWRGYYYSDYSVRVKANPIQGEQFIGWKVTNGEIIGDASSEDIDVKLSENGTIITAEFAAK